MVLKLDMSKPYDRVSWLFLTKVTRRFGFSDIIIYMIWRIMSNKWYSILISGLAQVFSDVVED